ncbi:DNA-directed DNA polymerase III PolC [Lysobacter sp. HA35]
MRELLKRAQPDRFDDLIALVSLYRPGPMDLIPDFIERKHGRQEVVFPHALLEPILAPTYGVVVYQEQVMQTAQILGGYSLGGADLLRRAMGKKKPEEMAKERVKFEAGAKEHHGIEPRVSGPIFDLLEKFAGYGFNKSHAAAYALVSYQTAWLKAHYPAEFMAAVLSSDMDNTDKVTGFLDETRAIGITVLPPDVNESAYMFCATAPDTVRYGLGAVKGVGRGVCEAIVEARSAAPFKDLLDLCQRADDGKLNRRALEAMAQAGALDALGKNRASLFLQIPEVLRATDQLAKETAAGQVSLFGGFDTAAPALHMDLPEADEWPIAKLLEHERETLGHYLSGHPFDPHREDVHALIGFDLGDLERIWAGRPDSGRGGWRPEMETTVAGLVVGFRKKGDSQVFVQIEDGRGRLECAFFAETYAEHASLIGRDRLLVVQGGLREDAFSGGFALKATRCWEFSQVCSRHAQRLSVRVDLRQPGTLARVESVLAAHRPGPTPLRLHLLIDGTHGMVDFDGPKGVRVSSDLIAALRATPGVLTVKAALSKPWAH